MNDPAPVHVLDRQGRLLASCPCILSALAASRRHGLRYAYLVRAADGVELARNALLSPRVKAPPVGPLRVVAPPLAPPAPLCPVWAALRVPATIGELDRMLVRLDREGIGRRLLWMLDHGYVTRERGSGLWRRLDDAGEPPAAGEEVAS